MFFQSYAWVDVWSLDSQGLTPELLRYEKASFMGMSPFSFSTDSRVRHKTVQMTILEEKMCAPGLRQRGGTWKPLEGDQTSNNLTMGHIIKLCLAWITRAPRNRSFLIRHCEETFQVTYPEIPRHPPVTSTAASITLLSRLSSLILYIPKQYRYGLLHETGTPRPDRHIHANLEYSYEERRRPRRFEPKQSFETEVFYPSYFADYALQSVGRPVRSRGVVRMEIVLHEGGETRWTDLVTDIFEQNTVLPGNGTEKRTRGLFDDEGAKGSDGIADSERVGEAGKEEVFGMILNGGTELWMMDILLLSIHSG